MCLAVPGKIIVIDEMWAVADVMGVQNTVNVQLVNNPQIGEHILIHAGCAIQKINSEYFTYLQDVLIDLMDKDNENGQK